MLLPTSQFIRSLVAARLAADVLEVPTVLIARTDAHSAQLLTSDVDSRDSAFLTGERTPEGFFRYNGGIKVPSPPAYEHTRNAREISYALCTCCLAVSHQVIEFCSFQLAAATSFCSL